MNKFSVTLIHGTFAEGAAWTQPEKSKLCAFLTSQFGSDIEFERFDWDGSNRYKARVQGSRDLLKEYRTGGRLVHRLDQPHFVVAHSHGGSMLAYALRDETRFAEALTGVAFLSTPFIQARERRTARWVLTALPMAIGFLATLVVGALWIIGYFVFGKPVKADLAAWLVLIAIFAAFGLTWAFVSGKIGDLEKGLPKGPESWVRQAVSELDLSALASRGLNAKTLLLRANADEASSSLAAAQILARLLGEIPARIASLPSVVFKTIVGRLEAVDLAAKNHGADRRLGFVLVAFLTAFLLALGLPAIDWVMGPSYLETHFRRLFLVREIVVSFVTQGLPMGAVYLVLIVALVSVAMALLAIPLIVLLFRLAFGRWYPLSALFLEVSVETTPPGEWRVNQLGLGDMSSTVNLGETFALAHSSYDDPRAHQFIADWMRECLAKR